MGNQLRATIGAVRGGVARSGRLAVLLVTIAGIVGCDGEEAPSDAGGADAFVDGGADDAGADGGGEAAVDGGADGTGGDSAADAAADGGSDGGTVVSEDVALVATSVTLSADRRCDFDGDGGGDNAFAELGEAGATSAVMLWNALGDGALGDGYGPGLFFPVLDGSGESTLIALSGDGAALGGVLRAPYESMDSCGEPSFFYSGALVHGERLDLDVADHPVLLSDAVAAGAAHISGTVREEPTGIVAETEECLAPTIASLGSAFGPTQTNRMSLLEAVLAGGAALGVPGTPGLSPDLDLDGDGLERFELDSYGHVTRCVDGDDTVIEGRDCWSDERMADAFAVTRRVVYEQSDFVGRFEGWLSYCGEGFPASSRFGEEWNAGGSWQIAAGREHTCLKTPEGTVRCWGLNTRGQLGYGHIRDIGDDELPCEAGLVDVGEGVLSVTASDDATCAVLDGRRVRCWGELGGGMPWLGDDEPASAAPILDIGAPVLQLVRGFYHTCVLISGGRVRCWADSHLDAGVTGQGHTDPISMDEAALGPDVPIGGRVRELAAGGIFTCALLESGGVRCWGDGADGQLGYGNVENVGDDETPAEVGDVPVGAPAAQIVAGSDHVCALLEDGAVRCWGWGLMGFLGYGNVEHIGDDETPASAGDVPVGAPVERIFAGTFSTCVLLAGGAVRCWGSGWAGQLGYASYEDVGDDETPADVGDVDVGGPVVDLDAGDTHTCAVLEGGAVRCWGGAWSGQLGYGDDWEYIGDDETPASAGDVPYDCSTPP